MSLQPSTVPAPCYRCTAADMAGAGPIDGLCYACRGEVQANRDDARDELREFISTDDGTDSGVNPYTGGHMRWVL